MLNRNKYKRIPDLYVVGTEVVLADDTVIWMQVLNPFEQDEARHDAAAARSRLVLALKEHGSDEIAKVRAEFLDDGRSLIVARLVQAKLDELRYKVADKLRLDPEWREKLDVLARTDELLARPTEDAERQLLVSIASDYGAELERRLREEADFHTDRLEHLGDDDLWTEYQKYYLDVRGSEVSIAEYRLTEMWYGARCCEGVQVDGQWDHSACEGHQVRVFETKADVRNLPEKIQQILIQAIHGLSMSELEAKNSDRQGSSSGSSPLPSEPAASTASTPSGTPNELPGTSPPPSTTPSPSLAGSS